MDVGETLLLYERRGCGIGMQFNSEGEVDREVVVPPAQKCA